MVDMPHVSGYGGLMILSNAQRQARYRKTSGMIRVAVWVPPEKRQQVLDLGEKIRTEARKKLC